MCGYTVYGIHNTWSGPTRLPKSYEKLIAFCTALILFERWLGNEWDCPEIVVQTYKKSANHVFIYVPFPEKVNCNYKSSSQGVPGLFQRTFWFRLWFQTFWLLFFEVCWDLRQRQIWLFERWDQDKIELFLPFLRSIKRSRGHRIVEIQGGDHSEKLQVKRDGKEPLAEKESVFGWWAQIHWSLVWLLCLSTECLENTKLSKIAKGFWKVKVMLERLTLALVFPISAQVLIHAEVC